MIQKIIHSIRIGPQPVSELNRRCEASWSKACPGWSRMHWTDKQLPDTPWLNQAREKQPANATIWMRLWVLFHFGGVYVDNDAELVREPELHHPCFFGFQRDDVDVECVNDGCMGAEKGHSFLLARMLEIEKMDPTIPPSSLGPRLLTQQLRARGLTGTNVEQTIGKPAQVIHVYPLDVLYPFRWDQVPDRKYLTNRTISIHWWEGAWMPLQHRFKTATGHF